MDRTELTANLADRGLREALETRLKSEGFLDCLRFFELVEYLDPGMRKLEISAWENDMRSHPDGQEHVSIVKRCINDRYEESYREVLEIVRQYGQIELVKRISGYLASEHEDFASWLAERA